MKFSDLFKLSTRMFKARTSRTLLTVLGMSIGIGAILFLVSFGYGLQKTLLERITTSDSLLTLDVAEQKSGSAKLDNAMLGELAALPGVEEVSPAAQITAQGKIEGISADLTVDSVKPSFLRLGGMKVSDGTTLDDQKPEGVVITSAVAKVFGKNDAKEMLGKGITFSFFMSQDGDQSAANVSLAEAQTGQQKIDLDNNYIVVGTIDSEDSTVYVNSLSVDNLKINEFSQAKVKCKTQQAMAIVRDDILSKGLLVSSLSDIVDQANQIFRIIQIVLMLFGVVALSVSAIGMFNTMTIALLERTEEIGIMKSIGASDTGISMMFIMESTIMGFLGGLMGVLIGFIGGQVFNQLINFIASLLGGQAVSLFYSPLWFVATIIIFAALVGFITGFVPARRASKIDPLDALRYK
jgi:putative ABC transport system permease protein